MQRPQTLALLRGSAARVASAENRGPTGEKLDWRADGQRFHLRDKGSDGGDPATPFEELPVHRDTLHRARLGPRKATLLEARRGKNQQQMVPLGPCRRDGSHHLHYKESRVGGCCAGEGVTNRRWGGHRIFRVETKLCNTKPYSNPTSMCCFITSCYSTEFQQPSSQSAACPAPGFSHPSYKTVM